MTRKAELRKQIRELRQRIDRMIAQAKGVEDGKTEVKKKFDENEDFEGRDETLKYQPAAAVGYWREVREHDKRLDDLRAELRALERSAAGEPINVNIRFDGPEREA